MKQDDLVFVHVSGKEYFLAVFIFGVFGIIFGFLGIVLLGISITSILESGFSKSSVAFFSGGITCISIVGLLINQLKKNIVIKETKFNNIDKRFEIMESNGKFSWIPFSEIECIGFRKDYHQSSNDTHASIDYTVYFKKKDGAWIDIYWFQSEAEAAGLSEKLNSLFNEKSDVSSVDSFSEPSGDLFEINKVHSDKTIFKWKNKTSSLDSFIGYFTICSFLITFVLIAVIMDISIIFTIVAAAFASIFLSVIVFAIWKQLIIREYVIELNLDEIFYGYGTLFGFQKKFSISWKDYFGTQVNIQKSSYNQPIKEMWIVSKNMNEKLQNIRKKDLNNLFDLKDYLFMYRDIPKAEFPGFTIGEILTFEKILDSEISGNRYY